MARALGGVYVDFLPVSDAAHPVHGQCMASVKSFGDMMVGTAKALEDNIITSEERRELARLSYLLRRNLLSCSRICCFCISICIFCSTS